MALISEKEVKFMNEKFFQFLRGVNKESIQLAIKPNHVSVREICTVCGEMPTFRARIPFSIFLTDGYRFVCENCTESIEPQLLVMLNDWYKNNVKEYWNEVQNKSKKKSKL